MNLYSGTPQVLTCCLNLEKKVFMCKNKSSYCLSSLSDPSKRNTNHRVVLNSTEHPDSTHSLCVLSTTDDFLYEIFRLQGSGLYQCPKGGNQHYST